MEYKLMSEREKADTYLEAHRLRKEGREEEADIIERSIPVPAFLAKVFKEKVGADFLINGGWNLAEADVEFGQGWLTR
jgi:hypothetical protein